MFRSIFRTSWTHIVRVKYVSYLVVCGFIVLFLTLFVGYRMTHLLLQEKERMTEHFTYPLFLNSASTFQDPRVQKFLQSLKSS